MAQAQLVSVELSNELLASLHPRVQAQAQYQPT